MDQYHDRFPVYDDVSSAGNHFHAVAKFPDQNAAVTSRADYSVNPHSGATAIRAEFAVTTPQDFGGVIYQNGILPDGALSPQVNFGTVPDAGIDLTGATQLSFWARGDKGGEKIDFFFGGVGRDPATGVPLPNTPFPDSSPRLPALGSTPITLSTDWQHYTIDLTGADLHYVLGGFGWGANAPNNPTGAVFYLDDIEFTLSPSTLQHRLDQPRFLQSFTTRSNQPDPFDSNTDDDLDFVLRNTAFSYDNALALLAFLADGGSDSIRRARLIGDAFVYAANHDRTFDDGRIRTDYSAGDISLPPGWTPHNRLGTVPVAGFYVDAQQQFFEVEQTAVDTGNNAWVMIALLALYRQTNQPDYLTEAGRIGEFIRTQKNTSTTDLYLGFRGGLTDPEGVPTQRPYASVEHNEDIYAAFTAMYASTGDAAWYQDAQFARQFIDEMWSDGDNGYLAGTVDPNTRNTDPNQLPLDVQAWSILSLSAVHPGIVDGIELNFRTDEAGISGFDFNSDRDGVWPEGTGQMAVAYSRIDTAKAESLRHTLRGIQATAPDDAVGAMRSALHDGLSTGFGFKYFDRAHVGATAWNVFAQLGVNPYFLTMADLGGPWTESGSSLASISQSGTLLRIVDETGHESSGSVAGLNTVTGRDGLTGTIDTTTADDGRIVWSDGTVWLRLSLGGQFHNPANPPDKQLTSVAQTGTRLTFTNATGGTSEGTLISPTQVIATGWGNIVGTLSNGTIAWANGTSWRKLNLSPTLTNAGGDAVRVVQDGSTNVTFVNRIGGRSSGYWVNATHVVATDWNVTGTVASGTIAWTNGTVWNKDLRLFGTGNGTGLISIRASNSQIILTNKAGGTSRARLTDLTTITLLDWNVTGAVGSGRIQWSNGTVWDHFDFTSLDALFADIRTFPFP